MHSNRFARHTLVATSLSFAAGLALLLALPASSATAPSPAPSLQPLAFLAGSCWSGPLRDGSIDTHCFEWVFDGRFLRDRHVVKGAKRPYEGETLYAWDPQEKRLVYTYWASDGGMSHGDVA